MKNRKIIDLFHYGSPYEMIFTLGDDADVHTCYGDNWDTASFEDSDFVCKKFVKGHFTVNYNYNTIIKEPFNDKRHCRNDFKNLSLPCLAIVPPRYANDYYKSCSFNDLVKEASKPNSPIIVVHFGDGIADVFKRLRESNALIYTKPGWKNRRKHDDDDDDNENYLSKNDKNNNKITFNTIKEMLRGEDYYAYANIDGQDYDD